MFKVLAKLLLSGLYPFAPQFYQTHRTTLPFLCVITPTFDPALPSLKALITDLQQQTLPDFLHVMVSNGPSPKTKRYLQKLVNSDPRFIYVEIPTAPQKTWQQLQVNLGKRKNYALKHFMAERYVFIDADSSITDSHFIARLFLAHYFLHKDILVARIRHRGAILPQFPVRPGTIDMCNFTFSRRIAQSAHYPTDPWKYFSATDFLFFRDINTRDNTSFLPFTYLSKDARPSYQSVGAKIALNLHQSNR